MPFVAAQQFDLISDDPRVQPSALTELRDFWRASKELGGLLTQSQAARILDVPPGCISMWIQRGKLQAREIAGVRMVSGLEVTAILRQRQTEAKSLGGRGLKTPSFTSLVDAAREDLLSD